MQKGWLFVLDKPLSESEVIDFQKQLEAGLASWDYHGALIDKSLAIVRRQCVIVSIVDESTGTGGCSIYKMRQNVTELCKSFSRNILEPDNVIFWDSSQNCFLTMSRQEFRQAAKGDETYAQMEVIENGQTNFDQGEVSGILGQQQSISFLRPARDSWASYLLS